MARTEYEPHSKKYFLELSARLESYAKRYKEVADKLNDEQMLICPYRKTLNEGLVNLQLHWSGTEIAFFKAMDAILTAEDTARFSDHPTAGDVADVTAAARKHGKPKSKPADSQPARKKKAE
jgi:hypothetical protein